VPALEVCDDKLPAALAAAVAQLYCLAGVAGGLYHLARPIADVCASPRRDSSASTRRVAYGDDTTAAAHHDHHNNSSAATTRNSHARAPLCRERVTGRRLHTESRRSAQLGLPPDPPERGSVGTGYLLSGIVRALGTCRPIPGARVILWLANPQGVYDDASRATVVAGPDGSYRFESHVPVSYDGVRPHIHMRVIAPGFRPLMTTHLYDAGQHRPTLDVVLAPER
jgi:protocatechuate 3,4-dioxygenase beta subunit